MVRAIFFSVAILFAFSRVCHMNIVNYYIYMESCKGRFCYAIREINVSYNTENRDVSLLCKIPKPLDEEESLPIAVAKGTNIYEEDIQYYTNTLTYTSAQPCNDTSPLLFELISGKSHIFEVSILYQDFPGDHLIGSHKTGEVALGGIIINIYPNNTVTVITIGRMTDYIEKEDVMLNETSLECSVYEDDDKRACFCKENYAREFCSHQDYRKLDPSRKGYEYYHIYGRVTMDTLHYYYYFEIYSDHVYSKVQRNTASALRESGGNDSMALCVSYNGSASEVEYNWRRLCQTTYVLILKEIHPNFTAFAKFHDNEWHSLMWFDYLRWSKSYIPGNCSYEEQMLDGVVHPFAICMRRNVTEKFYKNIGQGDQTGSTLRITTDYSESTEDIRQSTIPISLTPTLLDQSDTKDLSRIAEMGNIEDETLQRFFNPYVITSSAPRVVTETLIFLCFCFTNLGFWPLRSIISVTFYQ